MFNTLDCKPVKNPLLSHLKLYIGRCNISDEQKNYMKEVPCSNVFGSLMYGMVRTRPNLAYSMSVISRFIANPERIPRQALRGNLRHIKGFLNLSLIIWKQR